MYEHGKASESICIVMIEDNPGDILLVREVLESQNLACEMQTYGTAEAAIEAFGQWMAEKRDAPNLVLLDWNLPMMGGAAVLQKIREWPYFRSTPVAILTSSRSPRDRTEAFRLGATQYIEKPLDFEGFIDLVGRQVRELLGSTGAATASP
jgi:CheY-like chemotaxis protein